jgi:holliday junction DNA helicase RuvA
MIAKLTGVVDSKTTDAAVVDVAGVGYLVFGSARMLNRLPAAGGAVSLFIETHVREDHIHLYGFIDAAEREWFRLLTTVQGVGGRVALAILGVLSPGELTQAIAAQDKATLTKAPGVGPKLAGRIATELKDKVGGIAFGPVAAVAAATETSGPVADAVSALVNLGYRRAEAFGAVAQAAQRLGANAALDALIKAGLKELSA